ncbi:MAG: alpha/beta hydrolase [Chloroflexi bacterium]|nr:alpha/beta hydrolase [Chloroflexota bacterium]
MAFTDQVDPELRPGLDMFPAELLSAIGDDPPAARRAFDEIMSQLKDTLPPTDVEIEERAISGPGGDLPIVIYQPPVPVPRPGLLWIHGGGYIIGSARDDANVIGFAEHVGCTVVSVDYRLAPESTYKDSVADCFAGLTWMVDNASELGVDPNRVAIGGASAGGGLTAGLAHFNRDQGGPALAFQMLIYPMLSDLHDSPSGNEITHPTVWNRDVSLKAWQMYLGDEYGSDSVSPYAAAARATDFSDLPPAFVTVGTMDLFRDEDINYAQRLMAAGIPTELEVYAGMVHGGELLLPDAAISKRMVHGYQEALRRAIG